MYDFKMLDLKFYFKKFDKFVLTELGRYHWAIIIISLIQLILLHYCRRLENNKQYIYIYFKLSHINNYICSSKYSYIKNKQILQIFGSIII